MSKFIESGLLSQIKMRWLDLKDISENTHQTEAFRTRMHAAMTGLESPEYKGKKLNPGSLEVNDVLDQVAAHRFHRMVYSLFGDYRFDWVPAKTVEKEGIRLAILIDTKLRRLKEREIRQDPRKASYGEQTEDNEAMMISQLIKLVTTSGIDAMKAGYMRLYNKVSPVEDADIAHSYIGRLIKGLESLPDEFSAFMSMESREVVCFALKSLSHEDFLMLVPALSQQFSRQAIANVEFLIFRGRESSAVLDELLQAGQESAGMTLEALQLSNFSDRGTAQEEIEPDFYQKKKRN